MVETMKHRLKTREDRAIYGRRKCTVKPVFGIIKSVMGFRQFHLCGLQAVSGEWTLVSMAWNLKRMFALKQKLRLPEVLLVMFWQAQRPTNIVCRRAMVSRLLRFGGSVSRHIAAAGLKSDRLLALAVNVSVYPQPQVGPLIEAILKQHYSYLASAFLFWTLVSH